MKRNLGLKIMAIILSLGLWLLVISKERTEVAVEVPVQFENVSSGLGVLKQEGQTVNVTVKGPERLLKNLDYSNIHVKLNLSKARIGENTIKIDRSAVNLPAFVKFVEASPHHMKVTVEETYKKVVPVTVAIKGYPMKGYVINRIEAYPSTVEVEGLESRVKGLLSALTERINISNSTATINKEVLLDIDDRNITSSVKTIKAKVVITKR